MKQYFDIRSSHLQLDDLVISACALYAICAKQLAVCFPMREFIRFFCVGITMANDDISCNITAAERQRTDVVKCRMIGAVRISTGGLPHFATGIVENGFTVPENLVPYFDRFVL